MRCSPPGASFEEAVFGTYINNLYYASKGLFPFMQEHNEEKSKRLLNDFNLSVRRILANKKALIGQGKYVSFDENEGRLQQFCDKIVNTLLSRKKDLAEIKTKSDDDYVLFLNEVFDFFLSEKNLPRFINLIFSLVSGGSIFFIKEGDYEKDREWLDSFEFKV